MRYLENGEKVRVAKKSGNIIPKPAVLTERRSPRPTGTFLGIVLKLLQELCFRTKCEMHAGGLGHSSHCQGGFI